MNDLSKMSQPLQVLLVADDETDAMLFQEMLADSRHLKVKVTRADSLATTRRVLTEKSFDAVLLDLGLPEVQGIETYDELQKALRDTPVVIVLTGHGNEDLGLEALKRGAQDFIQKSEASPPLLQRALRYAVERYRLQRDLEKRKREDAGQREISAIGQLAKLPGTSVTAASYSTGSLRERSPQAFQQAAADYSAAMDSAIREIVLKTEPRCSALLKSLGDVLGQLHVGPRDLVELHLQVLHEQCANGPDERAATVLEVGRTMLLELMGNLVSFYRPYFLGQRSYS